MPLTNKQAADLILAQAAENGIAACRMKDSTLVCITLKTLEDLVKQATEAKQSEVLILIKNGPELGLS